MTDSCLSTIKDKLQILAEFIYSLDFIVMNPIGKKARGIKLLMYFLTIQKLLQNN